MNLIFGDLLIRLLGCLCLDCLVCGFGCFDFSLVCCLSLSFVYYVVLDLCYSLLIVWVECGDVLFGVCTCLLICLLGFGCMVAL